MSLENVQSEILDPMQRMYLPPRGFDETSQKELLREYASALQMFDRDNLTYAWRTVRDEHMTRSWPVPAQFVAAARAHRKTQTADTKGAKRESEGNKRWQAWLDARRHEKARSAASNGVAWPFKCLVLNDGMLPDQISIAELLMHAKSASDLYERICAGEPTKPGRGVIRADLGDQAITMYRTLQQLEDETQAEIRNVNARSAA